MTSSDKSDTHTLNGVHRAIWQGIVDSLGVDPWDKACLTVRVTSNDHIFFFGHVYFDMGERQTYHLANSALMLVLIGELRKCHDSMGDDGSWKKCEIWVLPDGEIKMEYEYDNSVHPIGVKSIRENKLNFEGNVLGVQS